jgi:hypothetical protein
VQALHARLDDVVALAETKEPGLHAETGKHEEALMADCQVRPATHSAQVLFGWVLLRGAIKIQPLGQSPFSQARSLVAVGARDSEVPAAQGAECGWQTFALAVAEKEAGPQGWHWRSEVDEALATTNVPAEQLETARQLG